IFEKMLAKYFETCIENGRAEFHLPADIEKYTALDDMDLILTLRKSKNPWARRIIERKPFVLLDEQNDGHQQATTSVSHDVLAKQLTDAGIAHITTRSRSVLSKYFNNKDKQPIFVVASTSAKPVPLEDYTPLYARYQKPATLGRVFVDPDQRTEARAILKGLVDDVEQNGTASPAANVTTLPRTAQA
ncbi:MAG TPA: hypothetical protein VGF99_10465, partial [Myxococcota bacterium]